MCGAALPWLALGALGASAASSIKSPAVSMPQITSYDAPDAPKPTSAPEAPQSAPVMTTQGQDQAQDEQHATEQRVRKNRQGRNVLRIDRTVPNNSGLGGGSGVNVPGG